MRLLSSTPLIAALCATVSVPLHASSHTEPDTARLRQALADAFGESFEIANTELRSGLSERSGTFWLVHARPRRSGDYELRYRYEYRDHHKPHDPLYTHVEHTSYIRVGEQGCWRRREGKDVCLGDTIILPFVVNDYTGHIFTVGRRGSSAQAGAGETEAASMAPAVDSVPNPLAAHLRYLGSRSSEMLHRNGGSTIVWTAEFQAAAPGRFNLSPWDTDSPAGSIPIVIVPRGQPVTVLLANETVVGTDQVQGFSSHGGNQYLTTVMLLQPGDRILVDFQRLTISAHEEHQPGSRARRLKDAAPAITAFSFHLPDERFNAWIAGHLPPPAN
jgi:hypothetical protein